MDTPIYLDYNATTPVDPDVMDAMRPYFTEQFGNPSSSGHSFGWIADEAAEMAREQVADLIGARPKEIVFTSGATEAINLAVKGTADVYGSERNHVVMSAVEHKAVLEACRALTKSGFEVSTVPVQSDGSIDLDQLDALVTDRTLLVAVMWANNEIGRIQPISEAADIAHAHGAFLLTDATQGIGKVPVDVADVDMMAFSGHKFYAPKGVGALYVSRRDPHIRLEPVQRGGGHEEGLRSGTLNVPGIVGLGKAAELADQKQEADYTRLRAWRDRIEEELLENVSGVRINGGRSGRLPQTTNMSIEGIDVNDLFSRLRDVAVSAGSACQSANPKASHVLKAIGLTDERAFQSIRISLGRFTTEEQVDYAIERLTETIEQLRAMPESMKGQLSSISGT